MFSPAHWHYNKIICGSPGSKYDFEYISKFNFECWNKKIKNQNFISIDIDKYIEQLCEKHIEYQEIGIVNLDNLTDIVDELNKILKNNDEFFLRLSYRSAKDIAEGRMPVSDTKQTLLAIIKSERCFDDMIAHRYHQLNDMKLLPLCINLVPWRKCYQERELRCFIFEKKLVAITNQFCYGDEKWIFNGRELEIVYKINKFVNDLWLTYPDLYDAAVIDLELHDDLNPILIEFNPYYSKGSTSAILFSWNEDLLYGNSDLIILRYCRDKSKDIVIVV